MIGILASAALTCKYPKNAFQILIKNQCPIANSFCIIDVPFDVSVNARYRCATAPRQLNPVVNLMNSSQLLAHITADNHLSSGYSNCMLTVFYAPDCVFSSRMAPHLFLLSQVYPQLHIVATDASVHSKLNSRYGIIATPTVLLWIDGNVVSRMDEPPFSIAAFKNYIERWTDLESEYYSGADDENSSVNVIGKFEFSIFNIFS
ncbi:unnamed protein product [Thelazia callipaeda]|uniref:Thioredoxin domain-containing protein n=1 Tax=Thelazia callipaeda TaxID=103827 RepID=A0A0N5D2A9_THECL|nr:unnamed protein product [Thelazia callipaeda]